MSRLKCFTLLPLITVLYACTFGEGPELVLPESDEVTVVTDSTNDTAPVTPISVQPQEVGTAPAEPLVNIDQGEAPASVGDGAALDDDISTTVGDNLDPSNTDATDVETGVVDVATTTNEVDDVQLPSEQTNNSELGNIVRIPRTDKDNAPVIDGSTLDYIDGTELLGGEWRFAAQFNAAGEPLGIGNFMFGNADQALSGSYHHWAAMHDGDYLYLVVVVDDEGKLFQDTNEDRKPWKDDSVELYFDGNNSKLDEYDGVDDFHLTVNLLAAAGVPNASYRSDVKVTQSDFSAILPSDLLFQNGIGNGPMPNGGADSARKDIYEFRIKLSELNIQIEQPFGFEVQVNDDDDGDSRDAKWAWQHPEGEDDTNDNTWRNPSFMGTAILIR